MSKLGNKTYCKICAMAGCRSQAITLGITRNTVNSYHIKQLLNLQSGRRHFHLGVAAEQ
jgi:hypothetical protein